MRRLRNWFILLPLALVMVLFAVANRAFVTVSFDPFSGESPALAFSLPLFIIVFAGVIVGVVVGTLASLTRQWRLWRAARRVEEEAARLRAELHARPKAHSEPPAQYPSLPMAG